jgi:hypothetical protein
MGVETILMASIAALSAGGAIMQASKPVPKTVLPKPVATPRASSAAANVLMARRGSAVNQRTGPSGAESSATAKKTFMGT